MPATLERLQETDLASQPALEPPRGVPVPELSGPNPGWSGEETAELPPVAGQTAGEAQSAIGAEVVIGDSEAERAFVPLSDLLQPYEEPLFELPDIRARVKSTMSKARQKLSSIKDKAGGAIP